MELVRLLLHGSWGTALVAIALGLLGGASNAGLLVLINAALHSSIESTAILVVGFLGLGLARVTCAGVSQYLLSVFAQKTSTRLRRDLCHKILDTPLRQLEKVGIPNQMVALTEDIGAVSQALRLIPSVAIDIAMLGSCVLYLGWLSPPMLLGLSAATLLGILFHKVLIKRAFRALRLAREEENRLFHHFRALTEGIKELRIHKERRDTFFSQKIYLCTEAFQNYNIHASTRFVLAHAWNQFFLIILVGLVIVFLPSMESVKSEVLTGYVLTILYAMGPLRQLMGTFPAFGRAKIGLEKIEKLGFSLSSRMLEPESVVSKPLPSWKQLEVRGAFFAYQEDARDGNFILGPIDFVLYPGEIVFVVGGNGSGKSTFAKLLVGLYTPERGEIRLNDQCITDRNREWYRQHFSVVFSDFYLFEDLLGLDSPSLDQRARDYLSLLQLEHKVQVLNGGLSTTALSQGQRRRLALLTAYLEDRPIYVFDEWAADQDPQYKKVFYTQLLPELKASGKGVIVITHDDRYFDLADRIFKLDYGKPVTPGANPTAARSQNARVVALDSRHKRT
jgi:putative pyoverdin transport system ATP-binding/permease protein